MLAVIRNPYTPERSYFQHLRKPVTQRWRLSDGQKSPRIDTVLAMAGDFGRFCREAPFYGKLPSRIERYYAPDDRIMQSNLRLLRFESVEEDLMRELEGIGLFRRFMSHDNASARADAKAPAVDMSFDPDSEEAVFCKFRFLFHFYERLPGTVDGPEAPAALVPSGTYKTAFG